MYRTAKYRELVHELRHEVPMGPTRYAIKIDGKIWKIVTGKEFNIKEMCARKTRETGREWVAVYWPD